MLSAVIVWREADRTPEASGRAHPAAVQKYNGSISAEHGLGNIKKPFLSYTRDETEQAYLRAVKAVFDPNGIMNPGKVI